MDLCQREAYGSICFFLQCKKIFAYKISGKSASMVDKYLKIVYNCR